MKKIGLLLLGLISLINTGCVEPSDINPNSDLFGIWIADYTWYTLDLTFGSAIDTSESVSTLTLEEDRFSINVSPPIPHVLWWRGSRGQWFGRYTINDDTLSFTVDDSTTIDEKYVFTINNGTLHLVRWYEQSEDSIAGVPLWSSGLVWGYGQGIDEGDFYAED